MTDDPGTVWIRTTPAAHDTYRPVLEIDDDTAHDLGGGTAWRHAHAVLEAVARAEHDAAVIRQMGSPDADNAQRAAQLVALLREDRPPIEWPTALTLEPGVSAFTGDAFLHVSIRGRAVGQWTIADAREHATAALEADSVATLDGAYLHLLKACGVPATKALSVVDDLAQHRQRTGGQP